MAGGCTDQKTKIPGFVDNTLTHPKSDSKKKKKKKRNSVAVAAEPPKKKIYTHSSVVIDEISKVTYDVRRRYEDKRERKRVKAQT